MNSRFDWLGTVPRVLVAATLALAPLPFGSVEVAWAGVWCAVLALSLAGLSFQELRWSHVARLLPVLAFAAIAVAVLWLQREGASLAGIAHPIWESVRSLIWEGAPSYPGILAPHPVRLGPPLAMLLMFLCAFLIGTERSGADLILKVCAYSGAAYAVYGFGAVLWDPERILGFDRPGYIGSLIGTFVNRNTAATYFGSCGVIWFMLMVDRLDRHLTAEGVGLTEVSRLLHEPSKRLIVALFAFVLCMTATLMTGSRAGTLLTVAVLMVVGGLYLRRRLAGYARFPLFALALLVTGIVFLEFWGGLVALRLGQQGLTDAQRWETYQSSLAMIRDAPWLGLGHGAFAEAFPAYRAAEASTMGTWDLAHNSLLELTAELGLVVGAAAVAAWLATFGFLLQGLFWRRRDAMFPLTALGVGLLGTAHSLVDFSLQILGYGLVFAGVMGAGLAQTVSSAKRQSRAGDASQTEHRLATA